MNLKTRLGTAGATVFIASAGAFIGLHEGEVRQVYADIGGVATYCFGGTRPTQQTYTEAECTAQLLRDTERHWEGIRLYVPSDAPDSVKAAMTSLAYNVGVAGFKHPKNPVLLPLAQGDWQAACDAIVAPWETSKGVARGYRATVNLVPSRGLENRRAAESRLCKEDL